MMFWLDAPKEEKEVCPKYPLGEAILLGKKLFVLNPSSADNNLKIQPKKYELILQKLKLDQDELRMKSCLVTSEVVFHD